MSYTAKDMLKFFDITKETLRFYDKEGLLHPTIGSNNYRYYSDWDVFQLAEYRRLRALDYSIKDIKDTIEIDTKENLLCTLKRKQQYYYAQKDFYNRLSQHCSMIVKYLSAPFNTFQKRRFPAIFYFPAFTSIKEFFNEPKYANFASMDNETFSLCDFMFSGKIAEPESLIGGTAFFESLVSNGFNSSNMQFLPEQDALTINLEICDDFSLTKDNLAIIPSVLFHDQFYAIQLGKTANKRLVKFWFLV